MRKTFRQDLRCLAVVLGSYYRTYPARFTFWLFAVLLLLAMLLVMTEGEQR